MLRWIKSKFPPLERFNQYIWAIIGAGIVALFSLLLIAGLISLISSMLNPNPRSLPVAMVEGDAPDEPGNKVAHYDICMPIEVRGSPYQLIKVVSDQFTVRKQSRHKKFQIASGSYSSEAPVSDACSLYGSGRQAGVVNVIVRHAAENSMKLLFKENAQIRVLDYPRPGSKNRYDDEPEDFPPSGTLYWEIVKEDSNHDSMMDEQDDVGAYLSGVDGSNMVRITPDRSRVLEKIYDKTRKVLLLRIVRDTNQDNTLDENDKPSLIEVSVVTRKMTREVLDAQSLAGMMRQAEPKRVVNK